MANISYLCPFHGANVELPYVETPTTRPLPSLEPIPEKEEKQDKQPEPMVLFPVCNDKMVEDFVLEASIARTVEKKLMVLNSFFLDENCKIPPGSTKLLFKIFTEILVDWLDFTKEDSDNLKLANNIGILFHREQWIAPESLHKKIVDTITKVQNKIRIAPDRWAHLKQTTILRRINFFVTRLESPPSNAGPSLKVVEEKVLKESIGLCLKRNGVRQEVNSVDPAAKKLRIETSDNS